MEYLTVKMLKEVLTNLPDDTQVYVERIEDIYFDKYGWEPIKLHADDWFDRISKSKENISGDWIGVYEAWYNKKENALKLTSHF